MAGDSDGARGCFDNLVDYLSEKPGWITKAYAVIVLLILVLLGALFCLGFIIAHTEPSRAAVNYTRAYDGFSAKQPVGWFDQYGGYRVNEYYVFFDLTRRFDFGESRKGCTSRGMDLLYIENADEQHFVLSMLNDIISNEFKGWRYRTMFTFWMRGILIREPAKYTLYWSTTYGGEMKMPYHNLCPDWHWPAIESGYFALAFTFDSYPEWSRQVGCWMPISLETVNVPLFFICKADRHEEALDTARFFAHPSKYEDEGKFWAMIFGG